MALALFGQGSPLPEDFQYQGEWVLKPRMFLYTPTTEQRGAPGKPTLTIEVNAGTDDWSFGFDVTAIAAGFGVSPESLMEANRLQKLTLERIEANTPTGEGASMKRYVFGLDGKEAGATIVVSQASGTA
jgi:hypothetical protein